MEQEQERPGSRAVVSYMAMELAVAVLLAALAATVIWSNYIIGAGWTDDGPQAGYFPMRIGIIILIATAAVAIQALRKRDRRAFVHLDELRQVGVVLVPLVVYVALIHFLGIYVASALFVAAFMRWVGKYPLWKGLPLAVAIMMVLFWVFEMKFLVPLPKGPLENLLGY
ncbi:tripartite tricarboxylate transporter TctB family protein [Bordetella bronchialis]|uniref:Small permease of tripartite tricarboxylate transporter n=1 Tax=Bordetella bronchialis TaxID=463025 RepID=A0A193FIT0_9BORD|nr:tripartite tricarboxylate transporter TctB family protein [Bordetella bronchialis]ANN67138.1 small permease of tripartite tricarboxylate transporter [Bordetella bronchialis]ANN72224.1 small permease of tripartite tricarboxylate transporter [Bordetella bronchialis]